MMKWADRPLACRVASIADATVLGDRLKGVPLALPPKDVSLVNRVQGINEDERTGDRNAGRVQALAKTAEEIDLTECPQSGLAQKGLQLCRACLIHLFLVARKQRHVDDGLGSLSS